MCLPQRLLHVDVFAPRTAGGGGGGQVPIDHAIQEPSGYDQRMFGSEYMEGV